ncbi:MAG: VCBS repeat-containing protein [Phycisphaerae bacterium]|nr:VCBS repeat-containing protein [Phycisphaerae bacterium]
MRNASLALTIGTLVATLTSPTRADDLSSYFGFDGLEVIKVDPNAGPFVVADLNGDGLNDLVVANNSKSRIELHYQKAGAKPTDEVPAPTRVNELPEHWRFRRENVSVGHAVTGIVPIDFDKDGMMDLVYAGQPGTIAFLRQTRPGTFELERKVPVKDLVPNPDAFAIADVIGDDGPDVIALVKGRLKVWPLEGAGLGDEKELSVGADQLVAFLVGDYDGDGTTDIAGIVPDNATPIRIWRGARGANGAKGLGAQVRFEMPPLREATTLKLPGQSANAIAVIERPTRRLVVSELTKAPVDKGGTREAPLTVWGFSDPGNRKRSVAIVDVNGDGLLDVLATNTQDNAVALWLQRAGHGLEPSVNFPAFSDLDAVVADDVDGDKAADIFLVSEKEGVVGRTRFADGTIAFPQAIAITPGHVPVVESLVKLSEGTRLAVVAKEGREFLLELIPVGAAGGNAERTTVKLGSLAKQPDAIVALDADRDGKTDLLLLTADKPLIMLRAEEKDGKIGYATVDSKDMGQFGLVQAAQNENSTVFDLDGDGNAELLVADKNFIRAVRYVGPEEAKKTPGTSAGWQVVQQINAARGDAKLVSIAVMPASGGEPAKLVAADRENSTILLFTRNEGGNDAGTWTQTDALNVTGFKFTGVRAGAFSGDGKSDVLVIGDDGFAIARLDGERLELAEIAAWSPESTRRVHHELVPGDVNGDGRLDIVALDAGEQFADILTFSDARRLLHAMGFKVFETRMFSSGEPREFEPSMGIISDVTGDKADDLILLSHDRILLYPQTTEANRK